MSQNFCFYPQISSKFCVYADYIIGYYMLFQKLCCGGNKLAGIFERVDCFKLTVKFQYWSCCDTRCNRKNVVWVLKELRPLFLDL